MVTNILSFDAATCINLDMQKLEKALNPWKMPWVYYERISN